MKKIYCKNCDWYYIGHYIPNECSYRIIDKITGETRQLFKSYRQLNKNNNCRYFIPKKRFRHLRQIFGIGRHG